MPPRPAKSSTHDLGFTAVTAVILVGNLSDTMATVSDGGASLSDDRDDSVGGGLWVLVLPHAEH